MTKRVDVLVIGGGVIGVSVAYFAARAGAGVTVIEKDAIGAGASHGNAGLIVPSYFEPLNCPGIAAKGIRYLLDSAGPLYIRPRPDPGLLRWLVRFCQHSRRPCYERACLANAAFNMEAVRTHGELADSAGGAYQYRSEGLLTLFLTEAEFTECREALPAKEQAGAPCRALSAQEVRELEPSVGPRVIGGILHEPDGMLQPAEFVRWLAERSEEAGVEFLSGTEAFTFSTQHGRVTEVLTTRGPIRADRVVMAGGALLPGLARELKIRLPIQPAKGYSLTFGRPERCPQRPLVLEEARVAVTPFADALRFAGTLELSGMDFGMRRRRIEAIQNAPARYLRGLDDMELREIWRGFRPLTADGLPILGRSPRHDNVFIAGGHGTKGMLLGPATGKLMARLLTGDPLPDYATAFDPARFA